MDANMFFFLNLKMLLKKKKNFGGSPILQFQMALAPKP